MSDDILERLAAPFPRERIHWRAQTVTKDGSKAMALAYLDARDVRQRLNEVMGAANWMCEHYDCGGKTACRISLRLDGEWITKTDGAGDTQVEAEKGAFSSALKRAAVAWGIGEYLYDMPTPWVPCESRDFNNRKQFVKFTDDPWKYVSGKKAAAKKAVGKQPPAKGGAAEARQRMLDGIASRKTLNELTALWNNEKFQADFNSVPEDIQSEIQSAFTAQQDDVNPAGA